MKWFLSNWIFAFALVLSAFADPVSLKFPGPFYAEPNQYFDSSFYPVGGSPPYRCSFPDLQLPPPQLSNSPLPGVGVTALCSIGGTPLQAGTKDFTIKVTDATGASQTYSARLVVETGASALRIIAPDVLPSATVGVDYAFKFEPAGGRPPNYYFMVNLINGSTGPPPGLTLTQDGWLRGKPSQAGTTRFYIYVLDDTNTVPGVKTLTITVSPGPLQLSTAALPPGSVGSSYSGRLQVSGASGTVRYSVTSGTVPPGLQLLNTGEVTGIPTQSGSFSFTVRATDAANATGTLSITLTISAATLRLTSAALPPAEAGTPFNATLQASGGTAPYRFELTSGNLPPGLSLSLSGLFSGTPTTAGSSSFQVRITDATNSTAIVPLTINVAAATPRPFSLSDFPALSRSVGLPLKLPLPVSGGRSPYSASISSGALPPGLRLNPTTLELEGTPLISGNFIFELLVSDAAGATQRRSFIFTLPPLPRLPDATVGLNYLNRDLASTNQTIAWESSVSPRAPLGLRLDPDGTLSGNPWAAGEYLLGFRIGSGATSTIRNYLLRIHPSASALPLDTVGLPPARTGKSWSHTLTATNQSARWNLLDGDLPPGLSLDPSGILRGVPTTPGSYLLYLNATGADGRRASVALPLDIASSTGPFLDALTHSASYATSLLAPGTLVTLFGSSLGPAALEAPPLGADSRLPTLAGGLRVWLNGLPARILYASASQASFFVPFALDGISEADLWLDRDGLSSAPFRIRIAPTWPGIFTQDGSGRGLGAILNQNGQLNGPATPAAPNSIIVAFGSGWGLLDPLPIDGSVATGAATALQPLTASVAGLPAEVLYAGAAPGLLSGVGQINLRLPFGLPAGLHPLILASGDRSSPPVLIAIQ